MSGIENFKLLQYCATAIFVINSKHIITYWNKACEHLTKIKAADILGTSLHWQAFYPQERPCLCDLIIDEKLEMLSQYYEVYRPSILLDNGWHAEGWFKNLGGILRYIIFDASPIYDKKGKLISVIETLQDISYRKRIEEENREYALNLKEALNKVKLLSGLLPICSSCKKIRDDKGYWNQIETYINEHSEAQFSHGICPVCAQRLYPELFQNGKLKSD